MNTAIFILFWPVVALIALLIWKEDKLIAFEQRVKQSIREVFEVAVLLLQHERQMMHKGKEAHQ